VRLLTIAVVLVLALAGASCGGDDETATETDTVATDTTTTDDETTTDDDSGSFAAGDCGQFEETYTQLSNAFAASGGTDADLDEVQSQFEEFVEGAPDEIEDDLQVLADAYTVYIEALGDIELDAGETPSAEDLAQLQEAIASLDQAAITEASANVSAWTTENC
jgi:hypothetical protein